MKNQLEILMTRKSSNSKKMQPVSSKQQRRGKQKSLPDYLPGGGGGGGTIHIRGMGVLIKSFEKNPYPVLWVWLKWSSPLKGTGPFLKQQNDCLQS